MQEVEFLGCVEIDKTELEKIPIASDLHLYFCIKLVQISTHTSEEVVFLELLYPLKISS